ncbi:MAG: hypothetical protein ACI30S_09055 [Muribaculaceae bacterium]
MKKFFTTILVLLACVAANAINVQLDIDDASRVKVQVAYADYAVVSGVNDLTVNQYDCISITATSDAYLQSVVKTLGDTSSDMYINGSTSTNLYIYSSDEGAVFKVTTIAKADAVDSKMDIYVDNPAKVSAYISETYAYPEFVAGWQEFTFASAIEKNLQIKHAEYNSYLYQVKVNDEVVAAQNGYYYITMADGMKLEIFAEFPDEKVPVKINLPEGCENIISSFQIDNVEVSNYLDADFQVQLGSKLRITLNKTDFALDSFTVNGVPFSYYNYYETVITAETTIDIAAHAYAMLNVKLNVTDPSHITVYKGDYYNNDIITLSGTSNDLQVSEQVGKIMIRKANGCIIDNVMAGENEISPDYGGYYTISLVDGMEINVTSHVKERLCSFIIYVDDASLAAYGNAVNYSDEDRTSFTLQTGYNHLKFDETTDLPIQAAFWGPSTCYAYFLDEPWAPTYTGGTTYNFDNVGNGSVAKFYFAGEPASYNVSFEVIGDKESVECVRDIIIPVAFEDIAVLAGTQMSFCITKEDTSIKVSVNDEVIAEDTESASFTVNADSKVVIDVTSGVDAVSVANNAEKAVYNLQGIRLNGDYETLPAGLYIVNGQKVLKK